MARINFEDDVESREEFRKLVKLLQGDDDKARGMLIRFWRIAQKHWGENRLVPEPEMEIAELEAIISSRWAIHYPNGYTSFETGEATETCGYYAIGSEERFAWYKQRVVAGKAGSQLGVDAKKKKRARDLVKQAVDSGKLLKPDHCERCRKNKHLEGHHEDYQKPLEVMWLCIECHEMKHHNSEKFSGTPEVTSATRTCDSGSRESNSATLPSPSPVPSPAQKQIHTTTDANENLQLQVNEAWKVWTETLEALGIRPGSLTLPQESSIGRAIGQIGYENTIDALRGARLDKADPARGYDPKAHLSIDNVLHRNFKTGRSNWERLANLARSQSTNVKISDVDPFIEECERARRKVFGGDV